MKLLKQKAFYAVELSYVVNARIEFFIQRLSPKPHRAQRALFVLSANYELSQNLQLIFRIWIYP